MRHAGKHAAHALIVATALLFASCASVPTSGPVQQGEPVQVGAGGTFVRVIARPPAEGMSRTEIVRGFLDSQASRDGNFAVARQYLTESAASTWQPEAGIQVYEGVGVLEGGQDDSVGFLAPAYLFIDEQLRPSVPRVTKFTAIDFDLVQVGGQWRIKNPPPGLVISRGDLARGYRGYPLWFPDPAGQVLVPETVILPLTGDGQATSLTQALLAGPGNWLAPAVRNAFPASTTLSLEAVTVIDGVARVPLSSAVLTADVRDRQLLAAQLGKTLSALSGVESVEILVGSQLLDLAPASNPVVRSEWQKFEPPISQGEPLAIANGAPVRVTEVGIRPLADGYGLPDEPLASVSLSQDGSFIAALTRDRRKLLVATKDGQRARSLELGAVLNGPRFDRFGFIWVSSNEAVWVIDPTRPELSVDEVSGIPPEINVAAVLPSSDGARLLVRGQDATGFLLALAGVVRGESIELSGLHRVDRDIARALSVGWQDQTRIALLQDAGSARDLITFDTVSGTSTQIQEFELGASLATTYGRPTIVATQNGELYRQLGSNWTLVGSAVSPTYSG